MFKKKKAIFIVLIIAAFMHDKSKKMCANNIQIFI